MDFGIAQMKSLPEESPAFPDIREQAFDELRRLTPYLPHVSLIDAVICNPVWSKNSCGLPVIEFQQTAEPFAGLDLAG